MKKNTKILLWIVIAIFLMYSAERFTTLILFDNYEDSRQQLEEDKVILTETIIKNAAEYEVNEYWQSMGAEPICYEYLIEGSWLRLRCDQNLNEAGMQLVVDRIEENIASRISESLTLNIAFKDYDYNTLEIFTMKIEK